MAERHPVISKRAATADRAARKKGDRLYIRRSRPIGDGIAARRARERVNLTRFAAIDDVLPTLVIGPSADEYAVDRSRFGTVPKAAPA